MESEQRNKLAELEKKEINTKNRIRQNTLLGGLLTFILLAAVLIFTNRRKKELNDKLQQQKLQIENQNQDLINSGRELALKNRDLETTLADLRITQAQLIQSEKLASLGELTAGIAHEIQNPLNFVNNFAEVSAEMIDELKEELEKGDIEEVKAIAEDLQVNLGKINHHGGRASSIVKGMLEHSRTSSGVKEPTDLNALADEFLRLAYHGLRAKDSSFNCKMEAHFDPELPKVSVITQDIGRVLLNLINNAFYAVAERSRSTVNQRDVETLRDFESRRHSVPTHRHHFHTKNRQSNHHQGAGQRQRHPRSHHRKNLPALFHHQTHWARHRIGIEPGLRHHHQRSWWKNTP